MNRPDGIGDDGARDAHVPHAHMQNFFDCIRSGKEPNCPFELGYRVSIACRMAVDSYRLGRTVRWDPQQGRDRLAAYHGFRIHPGTEAASQDDPRVHRSRDSAARDGVGRIAALSRSTCSASWASWACWARCFPEELGGAGYSYVDYSIIMEELARVDPSIALSVAAHVSLCTNHIYLAGNRRAEAALHSQAGVGRMDRLLVADRA